MARKKKDAASAAIETLVSPDPITVVTRKEQRLLSVHLTQSELTERAHRQGTVMQEYAEVERKKKEMNSDMNLRLKGLRGQLDELAEATTNGTERRSVECTTRFERESREVVTYRDDTGAEVSRRRMTPAEAQLSTDDIIYSPDGSANGLEDSIDRAAMDLASEEDGAEAARALFEADYTPGESKDTDVPGSLAEFAAKTSRLDTLRDKEFEGKITEEDAEELKGLETWKASLTATTGPEGETATDGAGDAETPASEATGGE